MKLTRKHVGMVGLVFGPILFVVILFIPLEQGGLSFGAKIVLGATLWMAVWWITEAIPVYVTALLPIVIFPSLGVTDLAATSAAYADTVVFLFLGGFMLAKAVEKSNLHTRFAFNILKVSGSNPKYIVGAFMLVTGFLSAWMSNTATTMLMLPIAIAVISQVAPAGKTSSDHRGRFGLCLMLSIAYSASIGGVSTLIGTPPNAILSSLSESLANVDINFGRWLLVGLPVGAASLAVAWWYMVNWGAKITDIPAISEERGFIAKKISELGDMTRDEKIVAAVFVSTAIAWVTRGLLWKDFLPMVDDSTIAIIAAISLFLLPSSKNDGKIEDSDDNSDEKNDSDSIEKNWKRLLDWKTAVKIPWGVLLLIGGGIALANAFLATGLDDWIAERLLFLEGVDYLIIVLVIVTVAVFSSEVGSNTATAALFIPIAASLATSFDMDPLLLMVPITVAASYGFMMPVATPPNAIVFASGYVTIPKMVRAGLPLNIIGILIVTALTAVLVPLVLI